MSARAFMINVVFIKFLGHPVFACPQTYCSSPNKCPSMGVVESQ